MDADNVPLRGVSTDAARQERLAWWRATTGATLSTLSTTSLIAENLSGNIENFVGGVEIPVGLAGPLLFRGEHATGRITVPMATTEGALVASTARGARAISRAGGVTTRVLSQRMTRVPGFEFDDLATATRFCGWVTQRVEDLSERVGEVSRHSKLLELDPLQIGRVVYLRFVYSTADASGQNMTTAATWHACQWINDELATLPDLRPSWSVIETSLSGDKRITHLNTTAGRGSRVVAEAFLDAATARDVLKTTPELLMRSYRIASAGSLQAGGVGFDIDAVNVIAAIYAATGQDLACVHESGTGLFALELVDGGVLASLLMPNLVIGTVGGGTHLPQQQDLLAALGCSGPGTSRRLAEIIAGFSLALDLSTLAAISSGQFADAHERLGRKAKTNWLTTDDLGPDLLTPILRTGLDRPGLTIDDFEVLPRPAGTSLVTELTARGERRKLLGVCPLRVTISDNGVDRKNLELVAKVKPLDEEVIIEAGKIASLAGGRVAELYPRWRSWTGFKGVHTREIEIYQSPDPVLQAVRPEVYGVLQDRAREAHVILMERLSDDVMLLDSEAQRDRWDVEHIAAALRGIATVHGRWLGRAGEWADEARTPERLSAMWELWDAIVAHNALEHPRLLSEADGRRLRRLAVSMPAWIPNLLAQPQTLVHGDFNPRNIALRRNGLRLVAYDWELATEHVPQRDLAELLSYLLPPTVTRSEVDGWLAVHREAVEQAAGQHIDPEEWHRGYQLALAEFITTRLQMYLLVHAHRELPFLEALVQTTLHLLDLEENR